MGRIKKKSMATILEESCKVFWEKGFAQTSMKDLEVATGLKPGSLYHSFKNKEAIFIEVMKHYIATVVEPRIKLFLEDTEVNPITNLRNIFDSIIDIPCQHRWIGCLMTNSSLEVQHIPEIKKMIQATFSKFEKGFLEQINRIPDLQNKSFEYRKKLANHLLLSMQGFFVLVRLGAHDEQLQHQVDNTFYFIFH